MIYTIYTLYTDKKCTAYNETNKARAIQIAREIAAEIKQSTIVYRGFKREPVAICEFPQYLRNLKLTAKDIYVNKL